MATFGCVGPRVCFPNRQGPLIEGLGLGIPPLIRIEPGQMVEARGHVRVRAAEGLLPNRQGPLLERLGLGIPALMRVEPGQMLEAPGHVRVHGAERLLPNRQGPLIEGLGLGIPALIPVELGQAAEARGHVWVCGPQGHFARSQRILSDGNRLPIVAGRNCLNASPVTAALIGAERGLGLMMPNSPSGLPSAGACGVPWAKSWLSDRWKAESIFRMMAMEVDPELRKYRSP